MYRQQSDDISRLICRHIVASVPDYALSTSGVQFSVRMRSNSGNIYSIRVNIAIVILVKICIEYIGISVTIFAINVTSPNTRCHKLYLIDLWRAFLDKIAMEY